MSDERAGWQANKELWRRMLLVGAAVAVYANTLRNKFVYDDVYYILRNPAVTGGSLQALLRPVMNNVFRPVTIGTFTLNWMAGGAHAFGFHLVNLLLHAAVVLLLYEVLKKLLEAVPQQEKIAFAAALLFAVHPIHTEAVASIVGRSELLAAGFLLAAWLLHLEERTLPALLCFLLALLSKESAVIFIPVVIVGDLLRGQWQARWRYMAVAALGMMYMGMFWTLEGGRWGEKTVGFLDNPLANLPTGLRILNALRIGWKYIGLQVYPATLSYDYSYNAIRLYAQWRYATAAIAGTLTIVGLWCWAIWTRRTGWALAGTIYFAAFAVTGNILVASGTIMGERLAYVPSAGFCLAVALLWTSLEKRKAALGWTLLGILAIALGTRTVLRNRDWSDNFTLYRTDVQTSPGSARTHRNLADEYVKRGELEAARREFESALRIYPAYQDVLENYGLMELQAGNMVEAEQLLKKAVETTTKDSPDYTLMKVNLASLWEREGRIGEALKMLNDAIEKDSDYSPAWSNRAVIRYLQGDVDAARSDAQTALRLDPYNAQARGLLGALGAP